MAPLMLIITKGGLDALVDAQNGETEEIRIVELGLSDQPVVVAPTLDSLPGEFKRLDTLSGESASETVIHMTALDGSDEIYDVRTIGLFLEDGTLFAAYSHPGLLFRKVDIASFLFSVDVAFSDAVDADIEFGDATFLFPPATESKKGVAELATQGEVDAGLDDERIVTSRKLKVRLDALLALINATIAAASDAAMTAIATLTARKVIGAGLAAGGGDLSEDRTITVPAASPAEADGGLIGNKALTPASLVNILAAIASKAASAVSIGGGGLVTGGGNLTSDRTLTVLAASAGEVATGTEGGKAVTPAAIRSMPQTWTNVLGLGGALMKHGVVTVQFGGSQSVTFPLAFPTSCDRIILSPESDADADGDEDDESWWHSGRTATGFTVHADGDGSTITLGWVAYGH